MGRKHTHTLPIAYGYQYVYLGPTNDVCFLTQYHGCVSFRPPTPEKNITPPRRNATSLFLPSVGVVEEHEEAPVQQPASLLELLQGRSVGELDARLELSQQGQRAVPVRDEDLRHGTIDNPTKLGR